MGSIQVALLTTGTLGNFFSIADVFNLPYIWRDYDHCYKAMAGEFGKRFRNAGLKAGYRIFKTWRSGQRAFVSRVPVLSFDDMKVYKMRCMESKPYIEFYKACGAIPTPIPWPEVYTALQKGVVDGADTTLDVSISAKHIEVTKYGVAIDQSLMPCYLIVAENWWSKLPKDIQKAFIEAQKKAVVANNEADIARQREVVKIYQERGLSVIYPPLKPFRDVAHSIYKQFYDKIGKDNIESALKAE
jgi:TRAP-type C4-dicarboxylate transport system substrate-binding protein